jgi:hypothetical protein
MQLAIIKSFLQHLESDACSANCMSLIVRFVKMADDGQLTETCRQDNNKNKIHSCVCLKPETILLSFVNT